MGNNFDINAVNMPWKEPNKGCSKENNDINLEQITTVYTTQKQETARQAFIGAFSLFENIDQYNPTRGDRYQADGTKVWDSDSYWEDKPYDDAYDFWSAVTDDSVKATIKDKFGLLDEEYDALACITLALASQETGMGFEEGYQDENGKDINEKKERDFKINALNWLDGKEDGLDALVVASKVAGLVGIDIPEDAQSASSGLTQMKIHDILNDPKNISSLLSKTLKDLGIESNSVTENNLAKDPKMAAIATMGYLSTLLKDYDEYEATMKVYHKELANQIEQNAGLTYDEALQKGYESILTIYDEYNKIGEAAQGENISEKEKNDSIERMKKLRDIAKNWVMSSNGSTLKNTEGLNNQELLALASAPENKYNEEAELILLNSHLGETQLDKDSLDCIRLFLSAEGVIMNPLEYIPHAWNTGAKLNESDQLNKYDRFLATQMGIILSNPETFQYDQFTPSVVELARRYADQGSNDGYYAIEETLSNYNANARKYPGLYGFEYD